jgi:hypothetical protein
MFQLFKKKSKLEQLQKSYEKYMRNHYLLSKSNRRESDKEFAKAEKVLKQIEALAVS